MKTVLSLLALATIVLLAGPASAGPIPPTVDKEVCTLDLKFIEPNPPVVCAGVDYDAINDFCVSAAQAEKCVRFVGPVPW